jgi:hypothetical protein
MERILGVHGAIVIPEDAPCVGLVLGEEQLRRAVGVEPAAAVFRFVEAD